MSAPMLERDAIARPPRKRRRHDQTLIIGLGNPIVRDDSVGLRVAKLLADRFRTKRDVTVATDCWGGLRLMERMIGFDRAIVIDAATTGGEPGSVRVTRCDDAATRRTASAHDVDIVTALSPS